jgi:cytochrome c553
VLRIIALLTLVCGEAVQSCAGALEERLAPCLACHGETGQSENFEVPSLGAQPPNFMLIQLDLFRQRQRRVKVMNEMAKGLSDDDLRQYSEFISKLPAPNLPAEAPEPARMEAGHILAEQNRCGFCHNPDFSGHNQTPRIASQREDYLILALREYKSGERLGYEPTMMQVVSPLNDGQLQDLAYFMAHTR